jgi:3-isopropylmalate dehydratase small subunit
MDNLKARVLTKFGDHISTDDISSSKYVTKRVPEELAKICMRDVDPDFPQKMAPGGFVVAGKNFGCGSGRETAPIAIKAAGAVAIIAEEFARIFYRNGFNLGLPCIECPGIQQCADLGDEIEIEIDKDECWVINHTKGAWLKCNPVPEILQSLIDAGGLYPLLQKKFLISEVNDLEQEKKTQKIVWLDTRVPAVAEIVESLLPEGFSISWPVSRTDKDELMKLLEDADFIIHGSIKLTGDLIRAAKKCKLIQKWGIGYDSIDIETARECKIPVAIANGSNAIPVAELVTAHILTLYRRILVADRDTKAGVWTNAQLRMQCYMIHGKRVGILGNGNVAKELTRILHGFGAEIVYYGIYPLTKEEEAAWGIRFVPLEELYRSSDIISVHVPMTPQTRHMIGREELALMKPSAILINTARGGIIDEEALLEALQNKKIAGAGLDVYEVGTPTADYPFAKLDNVVMTPHNGGGTFDNVANVTKHAYGNITKIIRGEPLDPRDAIVTI